ncbi:MAG: histidine phosphatase family protein [Chloroflexaceae bacterium]
MSTTIYLIRHAHAVRTPEGKRALSDAGRAGAEHLAALLAGRPIVALYSSPSRRARQTLKPLARTLRLEVVELDDLRERQLGAVPDAEREAATALTWADPNYAFPGGESNAAAQQRGLSVIATLMRRHAGQQIAVSTHGALLALILRHFDPAVDLAFQQRMTLPDLYALTLDDDSQTRIARLWDAESAFAPAT